MRRPSPDFHPVLRLLHWLTALAVLAMLFIGLLMVSEAGPLYPRLLALHRPLGLLILLLVMVRLPLRLLLGAPALPADLPPFQKRAAHASHGLLYAALLAMPLIGWGLLSAGGYPVRVTGGLVLPPILPHDLALYAVLRSAHGLIALALLLLVMAHLGAALIHGLIRRDGVLRSMTLGHAKPTEPVSVHDDPAPSEPEAT